MSEVPLYGVYTRTVNGRAEDAGSRWKEGGV